MTAASQVSAEESNLTLTHTGSGGGYGSDSVNPWQLPVTIVRDAPAIASGGVSVSSSPLHSNNTYARDETIIVQVRFDGDVAVDTNGGTPTLEVDIGSTNQDFEYVSMNGARTLNFEYEVQAGDSDSDGISIANGALELNGGTIKGTSNQRDASIHTTRLATQTGHQVNGALSLAAATLSSLSVSNNGTTISLSPGFSATQTSYTATVASTIEMVTIDASAADAGSATISPADASDTDTGHQVELSGSSTQVTVTVVRAPRPNGTYTLTLNRIVPTVNIAAGPSPVAFHLEGQDVEFTVSRDQALATPLDVHLSFTQTQSFLPTNKLSRSLKIKANQTSRILSLSSTHLTGSATTNGTLTATIAANSAYTIGSDASATISLIPADPVITVRPANASFAFLEDAGTVQVVFLAEAVPDATISASLQISLLAQLAQGTAASGADYTDASPFIVFQAADFSQQDGRYVASKSLNVQILDDSEQEGDEYFSVRMIENSVPDGVALTEHDGSACSNCVYRIDIVDDESAPAQVSGLVLSPGGGSLNVSWTEVSGADGYKVQWKSGDETFSDATTDGREATISSGTVTSYTIPSLTDGTTYTVRVIAARGSLDGTPSNEVSEQPDKPTLSVSDASATEGLPVVFTVALSRALTSAVTVEYTTSIGGSDTATSADFTAATGVSLTIAAGSTSGTISVSTTDDSDVEGDESFTLTLSNPSSNAALSSSTSASGTIEDNDVDAATVSQLGFSNEPSSGHYGLGDIIEISVTFSAAVDVTGTPRIPLTLDGTPASDSYALYDSSASSASVLVFRRIVTASDDDDTDGIGVVANSLELNGGTIVVDGTSVAANLNHVALTGGQIRTRVIQNITVTSEASVGAPAPVGIYGAGETVEFTVTFSESVTVDLAGTPTLTFIASDSGDQDASYVRGTGSTELVFSWTVPNDVPGNETQISVPTNVGSDDGLQLNGGAIKDSNNRSVNLRHPAYTTTSQADTTAPSLVTGAEGAIIDADELVLTFERGAGLAEYLDEDSVPQSIDFIVRDANLRGTSVTDVDVTGAKVTLELASPVGHAHGFTVTYIGSLLKDLWGNEVGVFQNRALRNDSPEPQLSMSDFSVNEDDGHAVFKVNVDVPSAEVATVKYETSDDSATSGSDYTTTNGTLSIPANSEFVNIQVPIVDDSVAEQDETFTLKLSNATNATIADSEATATIVDNETTPTLSIEAASAEEGEAVEFTVSLSPVSTQDVTVQYDTSIESTDTATTGDFTAATSQTLTVPTGDSSATISIDTVEDSTEENDETFTLTLSNQSSNAAIDSQKTSAIGTITNDDVVKARVTNVRFVPSSGTLGLGAMIKVRATFSRAVDVIGNPRVQLYFNDNHRFHEYALYDASASSDTVLEFTRQITGSDDNDNSLRAVALQKNKGAIYNKGTTVDANLNFDLVDGPDIHTRWVTAVELESVPEVSQSVTGNPVFGAGETMRFKVTFRHSVEIDETGGGPVLNFKFGNSSTTYAAAYAAGTGTTELTFDWTVPSSVTGDGKDLEIETNNIDHSGSINAAKGLSHGGGSIENADGLKINIRHAAKSVGARTDTSVPRLPTNADAATVDGDTLTLSFDSGGGTDEYLDDNSVPAETDFDVSVAGSTRAVDSVDVDDAEVTLTLATAVGHAQNVTVGYTPGTNPIQDLWDNEAESFSNRAVRNDSPEPELSITDATVSEDGGTAAFTVSLNIASGETVTVDYATTDDTAEAGSDYSSTSGRLTFDPGDLTKTISVTISDDSVGEGNESFGVTLSNATNASIEDGNAVGTITDNEQTPTLSIADATAAEGSSIDFTVALSPIAADDVTVSYSTNDGTATSDTNHADGADYTAASANASLTILAGQSSGTITVVTGDDQIHEPDETFTVTLSDPSSIAVLGTAKTATGTIENNDVASSDASLASLEAKVNGSAITLAPNFATGTYEYEADVENTVASIAIEASATDGRATIAISGDDDTSTPNEALVDLAFGENTVTVSVTAENQNNTQDYTLVIDRALPAVGWTANQYKAINEDSGNVDLEVFLRPASDSVVEVDYATSPRDGSVAGEDYVATSGTLRFEPGDTAKIVTVTIIDDDIYEPNGAGNLQVTLSNLSDTAVYGSNGPIILMLMSTQAGPNPENDSPPTADIEDVSVDEDDGTMTFVLNLSHRVEADVTYQVTSFGVGGTATVSDDYQRFLDFGRAEIEVPSKQTSASFDVIVVDDAIDEDDETITFDWRRSGTAHTDTSSIEVTGTIVDDDTRGVSISETELDIAEGSSDSYDVVLLSAPTGTVTVTASVTGSPDVTLSSSEMTFTGSNWNTAQTVTVTAGQDSDAVDDEATIAHTVSGADYGANGVTANSVAVTVDDDETPAVLDLSVATIADDDTINIAEKAAGFSIAGDTGSVAGVNVTVEIGTDTLTASSSDDGSGTAVWSVTVPANADYITGASVDVTVSASKTGFTDATDIERSLECRFEAHRQHRRT